MAVRDCLSALEMLDKPGHGLGLIPVEAKFLLTTTLHVPELTGDLVVPFLRPPEVLCAQFFDAGDGQRVISRPLPDL